MEKLSWYILRRLLVVVIGLLVILTAEFYILRVIPDEPLLSLRPYSPYQYPEWFEKVTDMFNQPLYAQYLEFIGDMLSGDFGFSPAHRSDVGDYIYSAMWKTLVLFGVALSLCLVLGSLAGRALSRIRLYPAKQVLSILSLALFAFPVIAWQWYVRWYFSVEWRLLPVLGSTSFASSGIDLEHSILPWISIFLASVGAFVLCIRDGHAKASHALTPNRLTLRDGLFAAMPSMQFMVTVTLLFVVFAELLFRYPGLGYTFITSLYSMDYFTLQASFFLLAVIAFTVNFAMETIVTLTRPGSRLDLCLREDEDLPETTTDDSSQTRPQPSVFLGIRKAVIQVAKDYLKSPVGIVALAVFIAIAVLSAVGLKGATALVGISIPAGLLGLLIGMVLGTGAGYARPYFDGVVTAVMQGIIALPVIGLVAIRFANHWPDLGYLETALVCCVPITALVTLLSFHGFVSSRNRVNAISRGASNSARFVRSVPSTASWALSGLKYGMPATVITILAFDFRHLTDFSSWGAEFGIAVGYSYDAAVYNDWGQTLTPLVGSILLIGSIFLTLDTIERILRTRFSEYV